MSKIGDIAEARRKRDLQDLRLAAAICERERRIREHAHALVMIDRFYKGECE